MSWRGSDELSPWQTLLAVLFLCAVFAAITSLERCGAAMGWLHLRSRPWLLAGLVTLSGCASIQAKAAQTCAQVDRVGPALTLVAKADEELIEAESRGECLLCRAGTDAAVCCTAAIDRAIAKHSKLRAALSDVAAVSDAVVETSHRAGVCK